MSLPPWVPTVTTRTGADGLHVLVGCGGVRTELRDKGSRIVRLCASIHPHEWASPARAQEVQLMRDVHQRSCLDLGMALGDPARQAAGFELWMAAQGGADGMDNEMQEIGFIAGIALGAGEDDPVGAARLQNLHPSRAQMCEQVPPGATVTRQVAGNTPLVHGLMIERLDLRIECRVDLRLQDRRTVEGDTAIQQPARPQQRQETRQRGRDIQQIQDRMGDQ